MDDDESIHQVWRKRFSGYQIELEHFYNSNSLLNSYETIPESVFLLSDFELLGESINGLDCIRKLNCISKCILVTARFDEEKIQKETIIEGIKTLPKSMALLIPILNDIDHKKKIVLIDDDKLCHLGWQRRGSKLGIQVISYFSVEDFMNDSENHSFDTCIYIDSNLGNGIKGEVESHSLFKLGFQNLFISTGYHKNTIEKPTWIKEVLSKNLDEIFNS